MLNNNLSRARLIAIWCLSVTTIGAWRVVSGAALTIVNGEWLFAGCILPPLMMLMVWRHRTRLALAVTAAALVGAIAAPSVRAQSASHYREFQLGVDRASVSALTGVSDAKTLHSRPAVIQELRWQRPYSTPSDTVQQIVFSFYNDQLSRMVVDYDRERTVGMTDADLVEAFSTTYGARLKLGVKSHGLPSMLEQESGMLVARWGDADFSVVLYRSSYAGLRLIVTSSHLEALSRTAIVEAARLDEREAPRREVERQKKEAAAATALQETARLANKAAFRP
jgi:hypothetical protein